jgi:hypothetical protein
MRLVLYLVLQKSYSFCHSLFVQTNSLTPYFLQYLLTRRFYHFQRHFLSGDNGNRKLFNLSQILELYFGAYLHMKLPLSMPVSEFPGTLFLNVRLRVIFCLLNGTCQSFYVALTTKHLLHMSLFSPRSYWVYVLVGNWAPAGIFTCIWDININVKIYCWW